MCGGELVQLLELPLKLRNKPAFLNARNQPGFRQNRRQRFCTLKNSSRNYRIVGLALLQGCTVDLRIFIIRIILMMSGRDLLKNHAVHGREFMPLIFFYQKQIPLIEQVCVAFYLNLHAPIQHMKCLFFALMMMIRMLLSRQLDN